jgi:hypothetical protein
MEGSSERAALGTKSPKQHHGQNSRAKRVADHHVVGERMYYRVGLGMKDKELVYLGTARDGRVNLKLMVTMLLQVMVKL